MSLKILLADDSMTAQNMGKKILTDAGYEVVAVSNGAAALKKIAEHKPDLAVLDIYMPGYTGLEVCERVKSTLETSKTPVLLTVGKMEPYRVEDGARVHADGVIVKPFEATDLLAAIEKLSDKLASAKPAWQRDSDERSASPNDIETSSFQAVKSEDTTENTTAERFHLSQEMQSAPAMDFASIGIEPVQHEIVSAAEMAIGAPVELPEPEFAADSATIPWQPAGFVIEDHASVDQHDEPIFAATSADTAADPGLELPPSADAASETFAPIEPFEVEFNSAPVVGDVEVAPAPELEADVAETTANIEAITDPALLAAAEVATAFPTSFGSEIVAGIDEPHSADATSVSPELHEAVSAEVPALAADVHEGSDEFESRVAAAMAAYERLGVAEPSAADKSLAEQGSTEPAPLSAWHAEQVDVDPAEASVSLEAELAQHFPGVKFNAAPDFEPIPSVDAFAAQHEPSVMVAEAVPASAAPTHSAPEFSAPEVFAPSVAEAEPVPSVAADPVPEPQVVAEAEPMEHASIALPAAATFGGLAAAAAHVLSQTPTESIEDGVIAQAIHRVLDRLKPQIVSEIARELAKKDEK